jgi:hypothetical protein
VGHCSQVDILYIFVLLVLTILCCVLGDLNVDFLFENNMSSVVSHILFPQNDFKFSYLLPFTCTLKLHALCTKVVVDKIFNRLASQTKMPVKFLCQFFIFHFSSTFNI